MEYRIMPLEKVKKTNNNKKHENTFNKKENEQNDDFKVLLDNETSRLKKIEELKQTRANLVNKGELYLNTNRSKIR